MPGHDGSGLAVYRLGVHRVTFSGFAHVPTHLHRFIDPFFVAKRTHNFLTTLFSGCLGPRSLATVTRGVMLYGKSDVLTDSPGELV